MINKQYKKMTFFDKLLFNILLFNNLTLDYLIINNQVLIEYCVRW